MSGLAYLEQILSNYQVDSSIHTGVKTAFVPVIKQWANPYLLSFDYSGSTAKGTAVSCSSDVDFFISLSSQAPGTLSDIYNALFEKLSSFTDLIVRKQNVSIGVTWQGHNIDFTPGRKWTGNTNDHSLYKNKQSTWTLTNVQRHINVVSSSNRIDEIKLTKIWRHNFSLDFPSIYLELFVINALQGCQQNNLEANFQKVLETIANSIETKRIVDPSNTGNIISDDLTALEKKALAQQAHTSAQSRTWSNVVW